MDTAGMLLQKGHSKSRCYWSRLFFFCWKFWQCTAASYHTPVLFLYYQQKQECRVSLMPVAEQVSSCNESSFCWQEHREAGRHWWVWMYASQHEALAKKLLLSLVDKIPVLGKFKNLQEFLVQRYQPGRHLLTMTWCFPPPPALQHEFFYLLLFILWQRLQTLLQRQHQAE